MSHQLKTDQSDYTIAFGVLSLFDPALYDFYRITILRKAEELHSVSGFRFFFSRFMSDYTGITDYLQC